MNRHHQRLTKPRKCLRLVGYAAVTLTVLGACSSDHGLWTSAPIVTIARVDVAAGSSLVEVGTVLSLTATVTDGNGALILDRAVAWTSSDTTIATVTSTGNLSAAVRGVGPGPATISAVLEGKMGSVTLTATPARGTVPLPLPLPLSLEAFIYTEAEGLVPIEGLPGATSSYAAAINDAGTVVGTSVIEGKEHAFLWSREKGTIDLGMLPGASRTLATAINDSGQVVGFSGGPIVDNRAISHAFRWSAATGMVDLGVPSGAVGSMAKSINNTGEVAGVSVLNPNPFQSRPVRWTRTGAIESLDILGPDTDGVAAAINDAGEIVGYTSDGDYYWFARIRAVIWRPGSQPNVIGSCGDGCQVDAEAISQNGRVAGVREGRAFVWSESAGFSDLGVLSGATYSVAKGINDLGQVVLNNRYPNATRASVVTLTGSMRDLGVLPGKSSTVAAAINNKGQIVGYGQ